MLDVEVAKREAERAREMAKVIRDATRDRKGYLVRLVYRPSSVLVFGAGAGIPRISGFQINKYGATDAVTFDCEKSAIECADNWNVRATDDAHLAEVAKIANTGAISANNLEEWANQLEWFANARARMLDQYPELAR